MRNAKSESKAAPADTPPLAHLGLRYFQIGFESVRLRLPFNPDLTANSELQSSYENGRLNAINILAAGMDLVPWPYGHPAPEHLVNAAWTAKETIGPPCPCQIPKEQRPAPVYT